ncbi:sigma-70 family RNA polymerase sigma factor [Demequina sp.]|uniref:sigma-70 family RNA polymerase sigma factor n=1 Tax=Demequina sp. TaxID=2050685 RepID=UPI0025C68AA8|nr:sigma-70 family RNA polymerase sigma factor [Demequina sp.]
MTKWADVLERLVRERGRSLVTYGFLLTGNSRDAEDLFHDAVVKTFSRGKGTVSLGEAEAYVRRAMFSAHMDAGRRDSAWRRVFHLLGNDETQKSGAEAVEFRTDLQEALRQLSPRERACTVLRFYDDLTAVAIARELGITEGAVRRYLSDAAVKLRGMLGNFHDDPSQGVAYAEVHENSRKGARS